MKATLFHQHSGPELLKYTNFTTLELKPGEALVKLHVAGLNFIDALVRKGATNFDIDNQFIFARYRSIIGSSKSNIFNLKTARDLIVAGKLSPIMDKSFSLKNAAEAQERLSIGDHISKITLDIQ